MTFEYIDIILYSKLLGVNIIKIKLHFMTHIFEKDHSLLLNFLNIVYE